jgi:mannitol-1-phosphate 5-dehydrogenase
VKKAIQYGAGNIGRGFMGQLFWEAKYHTTFIESRKDIVRLLNERKKYPLKLLDAYSRKEIDLSIDNIDCLEADNEKAIAESVSKADIIGTAVGVKILKLIAPFLAKGLKERKGENPRPVDIYLCENTLEASNILKEAVFEYLTPEEINWAEDNVGFVGTVVARMVPPTSDRFGIKDPLFTVADSFHKLPVNKKNIRAFLPEIQGIEPVNNFTAEFERKLFTHNLGHAVMGYLGYLKNYTYVHEPFDDKFIRPIYDRALDETSQALINKYPQDITAENQKSIRKDVDIRFSNPMIMDTVYRVARDPVRKLGPDDRLIGSVKLCIENGVFPENIAYVCGAAFNYNYSNDETAKKLEYMIQKNGIEKTVETVSEINVESKFGKKIIESYCDIKKKRKDWKK